MEMDGFWLIQQHSNQLRKTRGPKSASVSEIPGLKKKPSLFFVTWISIIFVNRLGNYLRLLWSESLENQNGIPQVQKNLKPFGHEAWLEGRSEALLTK